MGNGYLVQKSDDDYVDPTETIASVELSEIGAAIALRDSEPGRFDGKDEAALYPPDKDPGPDPEKENSARYVALMHSAAYTARSGWLVLTTTTGEAHDNDAVTYARETCAATQQHLARALLAKPPRDAVDAYTDAYCSVVMLLGAMPDASYREVDDLRAIMKLLVPPVGFIAPKTVAEAQKRNAGAAKHEDDKSDVIANELRFGVQAMEDAIADFRWETDPKKEKPRLVAGLATAANAASYVELMLSDKTLGFGSLSADHVQAINGFLDVAQRLIYWGMFGDPVGDACAALAKASAPLAARVGHAELAVEAPRSVVGEETVDMYETDLIQAWHALFQNQRDALEKLAKREEPKTPPSWDETLISGLCELALAAVFAGVGSALGAAITAAVKSRVTQAFVSGITKKCVETVGKSLGGTIPAKSTNPRHDFFIGQRDALAETEQAILLDLVHGAIRDARRSEAGGQALTAMVESLNASAKTVGDHTRLQAIQAWSCYVASANYGSDDRSGASDLTGVGPGIQGVPMVNGFKKVPGVAMESQDHVRAQGVLELHVALSDGPKIKEAALAGLRSDDRSDLNGIRVGDLIMPVQLYIHDNFFRVPLPERAEATTPTHAVISRNEAGVFWLRDANLLGRAALAGRVKGGNDKSDEDVLRGAADLWSALADERLPAVKS
jgi:hypothetical protein